MTTVDKPDFYSAKHAAAFTFPGAVVALDPAAISSGDVRMCCSASLSMSRELHSTSAAAPGIRARNLASRVERVDGLDISANMIEGAQCQPGGDAANIRWSVGAAEKTALDPTSNSRGVTRSGAGTTVPVYAFVASGCGTTTPPGRRWPRRGW